MLLRSLFCVALLTSTSEARAATPQFDLPLVDAFVAGDHDVRLVSRATLRFAPKLSLDDAEQEGPEAPSSASEAPMTRTEKRAQRYEKSWQGLLTTGAILTSVGVIVAGLTVGGAVALFNAGGFLGAIAGALVVVVGGASAIALLAVGAPMLGVGAHRKRMLDKAEREADAGRQRHRVQVIPTPIVRRDGGGLGLVARF
jgi:hypothetical protein